MDSEEKRYDPKQRARSELYAAGQKKRGLTRVCVWVPKAFRDELIDIAKEMVEEGGM